jgi:hypothetical protein
VVLEHLTFSFLIVCIVLGKGQEHPGGANVVQEYSFAEVTAMTNNFKQTLGVGSFGTVCYGKLPDGQEVAVKRASPDSQQGAKEFYNEVNYCLTPINRCGSQTINHVSPQLI